MQAVILTGGCNNTNDNFALGMIKVDEHSLLERIVLQLKEVDVSDIYIIGEQSNKTMELVEDLEIKSVHYIDSDIIEFNACEFNDLFSKDDTLVLKSNIIVDLDVIKEIMNRDENVIVTVDKYKSWMTGKSLLINYLDKVVGLDDDYSDIKNMFKDVGIYKIKSGLIRKHDFMCNKYIINQNNEFINILLSLFIDGINCHYIDKKWCEVNNYQDLILAKILFSDDDIIVADSMLNSWGGYWRYPDYLDYFYLVTPYYPTNQLVEELKANFTELLINYPSGMKVNSLLAADEFNVNVENIVIGNGAAELIKSLMSFIKGKTGFIRPTFEEYPNRYFNEEKIVFEVKTDDFNYTAEDIITYFDKQNIDNLVLVNPENPSGNYIDKKNLITLLDWAINKKIKLVVDESFVDFVDEDDPSIIKQDIIDKYNNIYIIKSISKSYGVPGLRLGILVSGDVECISWIKRDVSIWNINSFAEFYMQISRKYRKDYIEALRRFREERFLFQNSLKEIKEIRVIPSQANYIMIELLDGIDAEKLKYKMLRDENIFIKTLTKKIKNGKQYLRIAIRNHDDNIKFINALSRVLKNKDSVRSD